MRTTTERLTRGTSPITSTLLGDWLRITLADESAAMIQLIIDNASDMVQEYTGRSVMICEYRKDFSGDIKWDQLVLPYPYIDTIDKLVWVDIYSVETDITSYSFDIEGILTIPGENYSLTPEYIRCEYTTRPIDDSTISMAILRLAAYLYERRGDCDAGTAMMESGAGALLAPYRRVLL